MENVMEENYDLAKWLAGEMTDEELKSFQQSSQYNTYSKIKQYSSQLETPTFDEEKIYKNIIKNSKNKAKIVPITKNWIFRIAAIFVIGFGISLLYQNYNLVTQTAANGIKTDFLLPDNSQVTLNSGSKIDFKKWNWDNNRELKLDGEAYFRVAKGKKFEVQTNLGTVTVLGTHFDVKARENKFFVSCYQGRVKVNYKTTQIILTHGQSVVFENGKQTNFTSENAQPEWIENTIAFHKENLPNIIAEIQRQYNIFIEINANYSEELFTGKIPTNNLDVALQIIATTYHLKPKKIASNKIIFEKK